jgi:phosphoribosylglycinamide formyltransferase 1
MKKRIAVLLSGRGPNFEALADGISSGRIPNAEIAMVISNREGAPGLERAKSRGISTRAIPSKGLERPQCTVPSTGCERGISESRRLF